MGCRYHYDPITRKMIPLPVSNPLEEHGVVMKRPVGLREFISGSDGRSEDLCPTSFEIGSEKRNQMGMENQARIERIKASLEFADGTQQERRIRTASGRYGE